MPTLLCVNQCLLDFCNTSFHSSSHQHADSADARVYRDNQDCEKFYQWFITHDPFPRDSNIMCISTGVIGDDSVNCYDAFNIGKDLMLQSVGKNFKDVKFERKKKVITLSSILTQKSKDSEVISNPTLLFQRICVLKRTDNELKNCFNCELAPYPVTLFDDAGMRKCEKSKFYDCFDKLSEKPGLENCMYVIDGGYLLHRLVWNKGQTYEDICSQYVAYVQKYYKSNCVIVFDGYSPENLSKNTKNVERLRRMKKNLSPDNQFEKSMICNVPQAKLLGNDNNKQRLIGFLREKFENGGILTKQSSDDADAMIVRTANNYCSDYKSFIIVGEDTDLLVILNHITSEKNIYFLKPSKGLKEESFYSADSFKYDNIKQFEALLHAFSGCDTTSASFNQGKTKFQL